MHGSRWSPQPKMFLSFFATRCLIKSSPIQSSRPNWKIDQFLAWIKYISKKACKIGKIISVDEQTCGFKGWNASKLRITYNKEGNGFQCDALCDDSYTFTFYFRHDPPPEKYNAIGISLIHARVMYFFDSCGDEYHICGVDNLYMSDKFFKDTFNYNKKINLHGVTRKSVSGLPESIVQEEVSNKNIKRRSEAPFVLQS